MSAKVRYRDKFTMWITFCVVCLFFIPPLGVVLIGITFPVLALAWLGYGLIWAVSSPFRK